MRRHGFHFHPTFGQRRLNYMCLFPLYKHWLAIVLGAFLRFTICQIAYFLARRPGLVLSGHQDALLGNGLPRYAVLWLHRSRFGHLTGAGCHHRRPSRPRIMAWMSNLLLFLRRRQRVSLAIHFGPCTIRHCVSPR